METGKGWMFFFGCLDIITTPFEEERKKKEISEGSLSDFFLPLRTKVLNALKNDNNLTNVSDLFVEIPDEVFFNPIIADIHIPTSLQNEIYRGKLPEGALIQDFKIIYDGHVLAVAALCPLNQRPYGVYDARDRFRAVLSSICTFEEIPPCLTHEAVVLFNKGEVIWRNYRDEFIGVDSSSSYLDLARGLYQFLIFELNLFYNCCHKSERILQNISRVHELESFLISDLRKFLETSWLEIRKRRKLTAQSKKRMVEILGALSNYSQSIQELDKAARYLTEAKQRNSTLNEFVTKISNTAEYANPEESLDVNSSMRLIEHARIELETYVTNTATMVSALAGAVIGSILTLFVAYLLGTIPQASTTVSNSTQTSITVLISRLFLLFSM